MRLLNRSTALICAATVLASTAMAGQVITWVAPYRVNQSKTMLQKDFGGVGMKDGLTYLALQMWITAGPDIVQDGNVAGPNFDNTVKWFVDWGKASNVRVVLCVTNYVGGWNWNEARRSFRDNRSAFVNSLVKEADRLGLGGVELDLEGEGSFPAEDGTALAAFTDELAAALHPKGKTVTIATYPAQWNAPNWLWWPGLMRSVDALTTMGYEQNGRNSNNGFNYADQKRHATVPGKLMIGMPGGSASWEGNTVIQQIDWMIEDGGTVGVGIWDCSLANAAWQTAAIWQKLAKLKGTTPVSIAAKSAVKNAAADAPAIIFDAKGAQIPVAGRSSMGTGIIGLRR